MLSVLGLQPQAKFLRHPASGLHQAFSLRATAGLQPQSSGLQLPASGHQPLATSLRPPLAVQPQAQVSDDDDDDDDDDDMTYRPYVLRKKDLMS